MVAIKRMRLEGGQLVSAADRSTAPASDNEVYFGQTVCKRPLIDLVDRISRLLSAGESAAYLVVVPWHPGARRLLDSLTGAFAQSDFQVTNGDTFAVRLAALPQDLKIAAQVRQEHMEWNSGEWFFAAGVGAPAQATKTIKTWADVLRLCAHRPVVIGLHEQHQLTVLISVDLPSADQLASQLIAIAQTTNEA